MLRITVCLIGALWSAVAAADVAPQSIARRAEFGTEISCPHFRARVRSYLRGVGELSWHLDEKTKRSELELYFKNRLAADPYDVAGRRVANVSWTLPHDPLTNMQVLGLYEIAARDYDGAQMRFSVPGRGIRQSDLGIEIYSPVRMIDICINGYIDLQVFSECPMDNVKNVAPLECRKMQTVRLSLSGVEAQLRDEKSFLDRATGARSLTMDRNPPCRSEDAKVANLFEALRQVRKLHNCEINIVKREFKDQVEYSLYARDLYACKSSMWDCLESELSVAVNKRCIGVGVSPAVRFTSGIKHSKGNYTVVLRSQLNRAGQLTALSVSHLDSGRAADHIICKPEVYGGNHDTY